jgi:hypothetical protein
MGGGVCSHKKRNSVARFYRKYYTRKRQNINNLTLHFSRGISVNFEEELTPNYKFASHG